MQPENLFQGLVACLDKFQAGHIAIRQKMFVLAAQNSQAKVGYFSGKNMTGAVQCSGPKGWNFTLDKKCLALFAHFFLGCHVKGQ